MRMLDLFSGIGGFSLAASWAGIETVAFCEQDDYCQKVLRKHWPGVPIVDDIRNLRGDEFGPVDIVSGGFPCQPFSVAGKREGVGDDRFLWPEMLRIIKTARPTWVLGENVAGIVNMALDDVLSDLEGIGYATQAIIVPACAVDAKHRRDRVWIVAHSEHNARRAKQLTKSRERKNKGPHQDSMSGGGREDVSNTTRELLDRDGSPRDGSAESANGSRWPTFPGLGRVVDGLSSGMDGYWPDEPQDIPRTAKGIPNRTQRLKGLGNAIVPQVAYQIFKAMVEVEN